MPQQFNASIYQKLVLASIARPVPTHTALRHHVRPLLPLTGLEPGRSLHSIISQVRN